MREWEGPGTEVWGWTVHGKRSEWRRHVQATGALERGVDNVAIRSDRVGFGGRVGQITLAIGDPRHAHSQAGDAGRGENLRTVREHAGLKPSRPHAWSGCQTTQSAQRRSLTAAETREMSGGEVVHGDDDGSHGATATASPSASSSSSS